MHALAELNEGGAVEARPRDVAADGLVDDRLRRRAERAALHEGVERLERGLDVEAVLGVHDVVDDAHGELAGGSADALLEVGVDDVVAPLLALDSARLAAAHVVPGLLLQLQREVLGDVAEPGALVEALDEAALLATRARVVLQAGEEFDEAIREAGDRVRRVVLEHAEIDDEVDRGVVGPHVRAAVDARADDAQRRLDGARCLRDVDDGHVLFFPSKRRGRDQ